MHLRRLFGVLVLGGGAMIASGCGGDSSPQGGPSQQQLLPDGGVNPITKKRVVDAAVCHYALAVMVTAGLYETSGDWLYDVGLPGKSGISGGIVTVSPRTTARSCRIGCMSSIARDR